MEKFLGNLFIFFASQPSSLPLSQKIKWFNFNNSFIDRLENSDISNCCSVGSREDLILDYPLLELLDSKFQEYDEEEDKNKKSKLPSCHKLWCVRCWMTMPLMQQLLFNFQRFCAIFSTKFLLNFCKIFAMQKKCIKKNKECHLVTNSDLQDVRWQCLWCGNFFSVSLAKVKIASLIPFLQTDNISFSEFFLYSCTSNRRSDRFRIRSDFFRFFQC